MQIRFISIKYKITIAMFITLILIISVFFNIWNKISYNSIETSTVEYNMKLFEDINDTLEVNIRNIETLAINISINPDIINIMLKDDNLDLRESLEDMRLVERITQNIYTYNHYINGIMIGNLNGKFFKGGIGYEYNELVNKKWFKEALQEDRSLILVPPHYFDNKSERIESDTYNDKVISLIRHIKHGNSDIGFVVIDIKCDLLTSMFTYNSANDYSIIVMDNNYLDTIYTNRRQYKDIEVIDRNEVRNKINKEKGYFYYDIYNEPNLLVYYKSLYTGWTTISTIPNNKLFGNFYLMKKMLIVISAMLSITALGFIYLISSLLTKDIVILTNEVRNLDKTLDIKIKKAPNDEIGVLIDQFNQLLTRIKKLINDVQIKEKEKAKSDLKALAAQINPHFLYNTLNSITFLASLQGVDNIKLISESLSKYMSEENWITIENEVDYLKSYLNIQKTRYSHKFKYSIDVEDCIRKYYIPKLVIQPIVENSLKHGIDRLEIQGNVDISLYKVENNIVIRVKDNGPGIDKKKIDDMFRLKTSNKGIGLQNVVSRMNVYFKDDYNISIYSEPYISTITEITIPIIGDSNKEVIEDEKGTYSR